jgi:hypothetical protein
MIPEKIKGQLQKVAVKFPANFEQNRLPQLCLHHVDDKFQEAKADEGDQETDTVTNEKSEIPGLNSYIDDAFLQLKGKDLQGDAQENQHQHGSLPEAVPLEHPEIQGSFLFHGVIPVVGHLFLQRCPPTGTPADTIP